MASTTRSICTSCLRALHVQARKDLQSTSRHQSISPIAGAYTTTTRAAFRSFSTPSPSYAAKQTKKTKKEEQVSKTQPPPLSDKPPPTNDTLTSFVSSIRQSETLRSTTEPYVAYGSTENLFHICSQQLDYTIPSALETPPAPAPKNAAQEDVGIGTGWWYQPKSQGGLELDVTFNTWAQVLFLHMYMLTARLRAFPAEHACVWHQQLLDHFFYAAEDRMATWHGMAARGVRNKYLKDLLLQWRGVLFSYDEGLIKGDTVLGAAVWRNVFKAAEDADLADVALVTAYLRREMGSLERLPDERLADAAVRFGDPNGLRKLMESKSSWMGRSFEEEDEKVVEEEMKKGQGEKKA